MAGTGSATLSSFASATSHPRFGFHHHTANRTSYLRKPYPIRCSKHNPANSSSTTTKSPAESESSAAAPGNALLKLAWYGSELLGIAASALSPTPNSGSAESSQALAADASGAVDRERIVEAIKEDFGRSYFVTGDLTADAYEQDCEFADPAGSFRGLSRFKRNCSNFGSLLEKSNMKLIKWEDFEEKGIGHWRFSCVMSFPWRPILSATGYTEYYFDYQSGKISRHVEHWNVPKMALLKQIFRPTRRFLLWGK